MSLGEMAEVRRAEHAGEVGAGTGAEEPTIGGWTGGEAARGAEPLVENLKAMSGGPGRPFGSIGDVAGKVWNLPNTLLGLGYGMAGHVAGELNRLRPGDQPDPRIQFGHNAVEFIN